MPPNPLSVVLQSWATVLGTHPCVGPEQAGRALWPVVADGGAEYFLKRLGPWRNLPVADEARVLRRLAAEGIEVAEFMITDHARLFAGEIQDSYVLMPRIPADVFQPSEVLDLEETVGGAIGRLHRALAGYPWPANSYRERWSEALSGELPLPPDVRDGFSVRRPVLTEAITDLPVQLVHGDLTPANVLLRRPGQVAAFIDFDHLPTAPRIWDVARYLSRRMRLRWRRARPVADRLQHIGPLLRGYHRSNPLSADDIAALPALITIGNVAEAGYNQAVASGRLHRRMLPDHKDQLADTIETARWNLANYGEVERVVRAAL
ncbi:phosphotransferase enzyme family protein [Microlunatus sp. Gsoil 973]|uniref:phosphotransferase enzyme family protein n=1 Tax=Microlunatus sp. Gsoil 973 TaxID=2672569 RepID=UPI0012B49F59|nr:phosphotransferase [Microlunatus sp. Gsoil 973]QGN33077.1 phosphotransferase [Microlunatus sp. Gsoil 973]